MKNLSIIILLLFAIFTTTAQKKKNQPATYTTASERYNGYEKRLELQQNSWIKNIEFRNVGPTIMSGRVVDIEVNPTDPTHFYVAYASSGLWETKNEGNSFEPLFQNEIVMTIGDIAVDWENNTLYIGSGENNSSRSSYAGYGIFKSTDGGKTWENIGLSETHHIGRIILHPENPDIMWVAALGHLYTENQERGVYKTTDGGKTWEKTLFANNRTGAVDLIINPENSNELMVALWEKDRKAWDFTESGTGSGLYKSTDGGESWVLVSGANGFPGTGGVGRIGLSWATNNLIYAVLDNQDRISKEDKPDSSVINRDKLRIISKDDFLQLSNKDINEFLDATSFPAKYNAVDIRNDVSSGKIKPADLVAYLEDANSLLFDTDVTGGEVYVSKDGGNSWSKTHEGGISSFIFTYGYYFGQIRHSANNPEQIYILGVPVLTSADAGKTWESINRENVHVDHHALWVNPNKEGHLILGNDGGVNISKDNGKTWLKCNPIPVSQFYAVQFDMATPYNIYGGMQDNGVWKGPSTYKYDRSWLAEGNYPYQELMGGDGMQVQVDTRDNVTVYTGYQFGNYFRINTQTNERKYITPQHELGDSPYRWNWQSPILLSSHNPDIVYFGSNRFHRSMNKGESFETLSGDLTQGGKKGDVAFGTLTTISESPSRFGLIYVGSDDGLVHVSLDAGYSWKNISKGLPVDRWVTRVVASAHVSGRVYASLNGYRDDAFDAWVYVSEDFGTTWQRIGTDLPLEPVNVIKEDPFNPNLLYVGTDHGLYASLDRGRSFMAFGNLPAVAVHDIAIHPREKDIIVGTHGRSIYVGNVAHLQALDVNVQNSPLHVFDISPLNFSNRWGSRGWTWGELNVPSVQIGFFAGSSGEAKITVKNDSLEFYSGTLQVDKGLNYQEYDASVAENITKEYVKNVKTENYKAGDDGKYYLAPGKYTVDIELAGNKKSITLEIKAPKERPKRKE